ncbi:MAG: PAS domain S-box protein [Nitrospirota bacterium]
MNKKLNILHLEDNRNDAELIRETLAAGGIACDIVLVVNRADFTAALGREQFDLILADYNLPAFDGLSALKIASAKHCTVPFLFVTGTMGEEIAVESLKHGATDYVVKSHLGRLVPSVKRALQEKEECLARESADENVRKQQTELEIQNNLLQSAQIEIEESRNKYADLYNFAPVTYLTLDESGLILEVNTRGAELFGRELPRLVGRTLPDLIDAPSRDTVAAHLEAVFSSSAKKACVVRISGTAGHGIYVLMESLAARDRKGTRFCLSALTNITERILSEERAVLAIRDWQTTFDAIADPVCLIDAEGFIKQCNRSMSAFLRKSSSQIVGEQCWSVVYGVNGPLDASPLVQAGKTLQRESMELFMDGRWFNITVDPIIDSSSTASGFVHVMSDITERKSMEKGLRDSLDKFRSVAEQSLVGIYIVQDGVFKYVNRTFAALFGYSAEEVITTKSPRDLTVPEDWAIVEEHRRRRKEGMTLPGSYEIRGMGKDGGVIAIEIYESQAPFGGRTASIGAVLDVSQRNKAEQAVRDSEGKLQAITRTAPDAIILLDDAGKISYWNAAAEKMFGYRAGDVMGEDILFIMPERFRNAHALAFKRFTESGEGPKLGTTMEMAGLRRDGTEFPIELSLAGFLLNSKRHASGIIRDISERKKLEGQLLHAQKMEAIGTLAGGIAHDFNNILNVIIGYGSMVLDGMGADHPSRDRMREVLSAADRAANLTKRLLMFSRKSDIDIRPVKVNSIVTDMERFVSRILGEDIELTIKLEDRETIVIADVGQMEQVLMNLVTNARDAMPKGGSLTITTGSMEIDDDYIFVHGYGTPGKYASISVADTGIGMNTETVGKIFEPFYTTKGVGEGTGLGLSIAYGIVKHHKGFIQVYSEVGRGSLFKILLPQSDKPAGEQLVADISSPRGGTETILIAEDEASLRDLMRIILESFGYTVLVAEDGEEVVRMFLEHRDRVLLVILDLIMPKKSGKAAANEIQKIQPGVRTLFMSGYSEDMIKKQGAIEEGLVFIQKPISPKMLLTKVRELLDA